MVWKTIDLRRLSFLKLAETFTQRSIYAIAAMRFRLRSAKIGNEKIVNI
jgi:hypothetical protein